VPVGFFIPGLPKLFACCDMHSRGRERLLPKLDRHFKKHNIDPSHYCTPWFFKLFLECVSHGVIFMYGWYTHDCMHHTCTCMHIYAFICLQELVFLAACTIRLMLIIGSLETSRNFHYLMMFTCYPFKELGEVHRNIK